MKCNMPVKEEQYICCLGCCVEDSANVIPVTAASTFNPTDWWLVNRYLDTILITGIIYPNHHKNHDKLLYTDEISQNLPSSSHGNHHIWSHYWFAVFLSSF